MSISEDFSAVRKPFEFPPILGIVRLVKATLIQNAGRGRGNLPNGYIEVSLPRLRCTDWHPKFRCSEGGDLR